MKKLFVSLLSLTLALGVSTAAFAESAQSPTATITPDSEKKAAEVTVTHNVKDSYTVTIPENLTVIKQTSEFTYSVPVSVSVKDVIIHAGKELKVSVSSKNYSDGWCMKYDTSTKNGTSTLKYDLKKYLPSPGESAFVKDEYLQNSTDISNNEECILTASAGNPSNSTMVELWAVLASDQTVNLAGEYKDTLTFTVSVDDVPAAPAQ